MINKNTKVDGRILSSGITIGDDEYLNVKISVIAVAKIENDELNGFPGKDAIKMCASSQRDLSNVSKVYWVNAASIIIKTTDSYKKVSSTGDVTLTGIGISGNTYNKTGFTRSEVFLGLDLREVAIPSSVSDVGTSNVEGFKSRNAIRAGNAKHEYYELKKINVNVFDIPPEEIFLERME